MFSYNVSPQILSLRPTKLRNFLQETLIYHKKSVFDYNGSAIYYFSNIFSIQRCIKIRATTAQKAAAARENPMQDRSSCTGFILKMFLRILQVHGENLLPGRRSLEHRIVENLLADGTKSPRPKFVFDCRIDNKFLTPSSIMSFIPSNSKLFSYCLRRAFFGSVRILSRLALSRWSR